MLLATLVLSLLVGRGSAEIDEFTANISRTLNGLLSSTYDKRIRPDIGGIPVKVTINLLVKSLGPVSENDELFVLDVYFRQNWYDRRLGFSVPGIDEFSMSWLFLDKIWKPDTYFLNGKKSHLHKMTSPNKFVRLRKDGFLTYSMRLTVSARCKMYLRKFPLDSQICPLFIGSYGYPANDVVYQWDDSGVTMEPGISEAQYDIVKTTITNDQISVRNQETYSVVSARFYFRRSIGYYVLQIYVPCSLIVCCSWISFWITPSDVAGRTSLAVTTVLSITTLGFGGRSQLPKVSHATALDWYVIICFAFAFAVMIEYAAINFTDKLASDIKKLLEERAAKKSLADKVNEYPEIATKLPETTFMKFEWKQGKGGRNCFLGVADAEMKLGYTFDLSYKRKYSQEAKEKAAMEKKLNVEGELEDIDVEENRKKPYVFLPHRWFSIPSDLSKQTLRDEIPWTPAISTTASNRSLMVKRYRHKLMAPIRFLKGVHFLPRELDPIAEQKFHRIDMVARRVFPITFSTIIFSYSMLYTYYIPDRAVEMAGDDTDI